MLGKKYLKRLATIVGLIVTIGVGELFLAGTFLNGVILGFVPESIHTVVGWLIIAGGVIGLFKK
jgi:flagellar biosynthesis protein FliQ